MADDLTVARAGGSSPPAHAAAAAPAPSAPASAATTPGYPNPTMRLDSALGVVVIAFHDAHGAVTTSIPSQQQLDAYRAWERTHGERPPPGSKV